MADSKKSIRKTLSLIFGVGQPGNLFPALHGVRFFAILCVIQGHVTMALRKFWLVSREDQIFYSAANFGFTGLDAFFIMSGFLIGLTLIRFMDTGKELDLKRFYLRRFIRTFPLYYTILLLLYFFFPMPALRKEDFLWELLLVSNYGRSMPETRVMQWGWALCFEEQFYLTVPFLLAALASLKSHRSRIATLVFIWLSALAMRLVIFHTNPEPLTHKTITMYLNVRFHTRYDTFIAGIFAAYLHYHFKPWLERTFHSKRGMAIWLLIMIPSFYLLWFPRTFISNMLYFKVFAWGTLTSLAYVPLVLMLCNRETWLGRFLSLGFFRKTVALIFGIYLVHIPVLAIIAPWFAELARAFDLPNMLVWVLCLIGCTAASMGVAYVFHILVEKPSELLRMRFLP